MATDAGSAVASLQSGDLDAVKSLSSHRKAELAKASARLLLLQKQKQERDVRSVRSMVSSLKASSIANSSASVGDMSAVQSLAKSNKSQISNVTSRLSNLITSRNMKQKQQEQEQRKQDLLVKQLLLTKKLNEDHAKKNLPPSSITVVEQKNKEEQAAVVTQQQQQQQVIVLNNEVASSNASKSSNNNASEANLPTAQPSLDMDALTALLDKDERKTEAKQIFTNQKKHADKSKNKRSNESNNSKLLECNYEKNPTQLFLMIQKRMWYEVERQVIECPHECKTWVTRFDEDGFFQWRLLPLHIAIIFKAPFEIMQALVNIYPEAVLHQDDGGTLPVDLALKKKRPTPIVKLLRKVFERMINRPERLECNYDEDPSELFLLLQHQMWDEATKYANDYPRECKTWVSRFGEDGTFRWRLLPLHIAIIFKAPIESVRALLKAFPESARHQDDDGMLPVDLAVKKKSPKAIVQLIRDYAQHRPPAIIPSIPSTATASALSPSTPRNSKTKSVGFDLPPEPAHTPNTALMDDVHSLFDDEDDMEDDDEDDDELEEKQSKGVADWFSSFFVGSKNDTSAIEDIMALEASDFAELFFGSSTDEAGTGAAAKEVDGKKGVPKLREKDDIFIAMNEVPMYATNDVPRVIDADRDDAVSEATGALTVYKTADMHVKELGTFVKNSKTQANWLFQQGNTGSETFLHLVRMTVSLRSGKVQIEMDGRDVLSTVVKTDAPFFLHKWTSNDGFKMQVLASFKASKKGPMSKGSVNFYLTVNGVHFKDFPSAAYLESSNGEEGNVGVEAMPFTLH